MRLSRALACVLAQGAARSAAASALSAGASINSVAVFDIQLSEPRELDVLVSSDGGDCVELASDAAGRLSLAVELTSDDDGGDAGWLHVSVLDGQGYSGDLAIQAPSMPTDNLVFQHALELRARKNGLADALAPVLATTMSALSAGLAAGLVMTHAVPLFSAASMQEVGSITQITQQSQWAEAIQRTICTGKQGVLLVSNGLGGATR
eukprot:COSAG04_NODE_3715_length_2586_cov_1.247688_1_plen_207_part_00